MQAVAPQVVSAQQARQACGSRAPVAEDQCAAVAALLQQGKQQLVLVRLVVGEREFPAEPFALADDVPPEEQVFETLVFRTRGLEAGRDYPLRLIVDDVASRLLDLDPPEDPDTDLSIPRFAAPVTIQ